MTLLRIAEQFLGLLKIAWRNIQQRALASLLTAVAMGLGVALVVAVLVIYAVIAQSFDRRAGGYELIVGKQGSELQLVLNTAYYVGEPIGNIPYSFYLELAQGEYALEVEMAVPICMGHSYEGYPVVGTTRDMFALKYRTGKEYEFAAGSRFQTEGGLYEAVVGSTVASQKGWKKGTKFRTFHGTAATGGKEHEQEFTVVGILAPTGTPNDRAIFVNFKDFDTLHSDDSQAHARDEPDGHDHQPAGDGPREVTAVLVCVDPNKPAESFRLASRINKGSVARAAQPGAVMDRFLRNIIGNIQLVLLIMAVLIVVVAGIGIMVSIYNSMSDRRHSIAVMRALGASRLTVMFIILIESILLALAGGALGLLLGHGLIAVLSPVIVDQTGVDVGLLHFRPIELVLIPGLIALASLVGFLPAVAAYRTDVARSLTATP